ncbi:cyclin-dependent kinase regulatory subunit protein [Toxoplasma gondii GT1]|uniref:Cyclin-dependent kinases regulatory subunit n=3 Tax=Toxoplasma gondii TaxID=5811 RepID=S7VZU0_TOXGG|nr:cyclin-dependent kinase regulatory subunit protein [Toxoplasma gondii GT1]KAF4645697.1 cyclin-dependent kinase regulatory subunit protein [Toxoplasma gondii]KFG48015.1 cyclin-dependent kinase regulatory subunit protein [Toxoplasma gondii FOU]
MSRTVKDSMNPLTWEYRLHGSCFSQIRDPGGNGREAHSLKYEDNEYEYKDVTLTKKQYDLYREQLKKNPRKFIDEDYMYNVLQLQQTPGWEQYYIYPMNPHVLCLRRPKRPSPRCSSNASGTVLKT